MPSNNNKQLSISITCLQDNIIYNKINVFQKITMEFRQLLPGYDITLLDEGRVEWCFAFTRPALQLGELVNEEDASPL
jgi:hypothetical protein